MSARRGVVVACLGIVGLATPAWPWACDAHRIVAALAWGEIAPAARERAAATLAADPIPDARRGCQPPAEDPLGDVAMWADAIREDEPETAPWHYIDLPRDAVRSDVGRHCPFGSCVTGALARQLRILRDAASPRERARALRFVVHLVADLHQPLHATSNGDRGGNCLPVTFRRARPRAERGGERWNPNLHAVWDAGLVTTALARAHATPAGYAASLRRRLAADIARWRREPRDLKSWAWDTHRIGVDVAYGRLARPVPNEPHSEPRTCRDRAVGARMARLDERIDGAYVDAIGPPLDASLARAGAHLAAVLTDAFAPRR